MLSPNGETGVSSPGRKPERSIWRPCAAHSTWPPSRPHQLGPREHRALHLELVWLQELPEGCRHQQSNCLRGSTPDFSSGLTPEAFPVTGYAARQRRFEIRVFLPLAGLPSWVDEPQLPEASGFKAPGTRLHPYSHQ